jgi:hypothetical protein
MQRVLVVIALLAWAAPAVAQGPPSDVATRARGAGKVVVARIVDVRAQLEANQFGDQLIMSHAVLEVLETLKGAPEPRMDLVVEGGTLGTLTLKVSDLPSLKTGERGVFFLDAQSNGRHAPHERGNGILKLSDDDKVDGSSLDLNEVRRQVRGAVGQGRGGR